jgi:putative exosortase-associated protein (TIGR04073 family)
MTRKILTGIVLLIVLTSQASFAEKVTMGDPESATKPASTKLWRGFVNSITGIGEIIRQPVLCVKNDDAIGLPIGIVNGVVMAVTRTAAGIFEVVTFPVPYDEEIGYGSILNPEYVWQQASDCYTP